MDDLERLNRVLDDLAAERDPRDRPFLTAEEAELAQMAALLKAADEDRAAPDELFLERLGARIAEAHAAESASDEEQGTGVSRRGLLGRIATVAAGLAAGAGAGTVLRGQMDAAAETTAYRQGHAAGFHQANTESLTAPMVPHDRGRWHPTGHNVASITAGSAVRFRAGAVEGFLVKPRGGGKVYALSAACTHMGCMISWLDSTDTFLCPCHGAQYNADGSTLSGIARHPLPHLWIWTDKHGDVFVWAVDEHPTVTTPAQYQHP